jgi:hypothetical protein
MGIGAGDYTHAGRVDIYNTTFSDDYNPLYRNDGDANFTDTAYQAGIAEPTTHFSVGAQLFLTMTTMDQRSMLAMPHCGTKGYRRQLPILTLACAHRSSARAEVLAKSS